MLIQNSVALFIKTKAYKIFKNTFFGNRINKPNFEDVFRQLM